ncbi:hypothetical protein Psi02_72310 [Planotetraspora silvatica]|uniref:SDR family NAD(P)-dependent oxidoreductase n=1 Tax=Planotetraspora silvatica TaxID=234614 RepID=A0A8J3UT20_9ACTN|nr:hypothetical protein Psi02_72310 [Planotetraspora silvatica]
MPGVVVRRRWGTLDVIREFSPVLGANGGGAIVNVLSALSWFAGPGTGSYSAAKAVTAANGLIGRDSG